MWKIKQWLSNFFYGRYGNDTFNFALLVLYLIIAVINVIARNVFSITIFFLIQWTVLLTVIFRCLSRNIAARRRENEWFQRVFYKCIAWFKYNIQRIRDFKYKRYRKCPNCKAVLRLPNKKGKHGVRCPSCHTDFKVNIII